MFYIPTDEDKKQNQQREDNSFNIVRFIEEVCNDRYILVVGSEVILNKDIFEQFNGDSDKYILYQLKNLVSVTKEVDSINDFVENTIDGQTRIRNLFTKGGFKEHHGLDDISPELVSFLRSGLFRFVMTTTIDDYIEILMREIWGDKLRVVNFGDVQDWNTFKNEMNSYKDSAYDVPTLVYVFGKAVSVEWAKFVKTDNDAIQFIENWMKEDGVFVNYIKEKKIMALGCKFENWYFRFFWYILKRDFQHLGDGEVAISFDKNPSDQNLRNYLQQRDVKVLPDARNFMQDVNDILTPENLGKMQNNLYDAIRQRRRLGGVFLSYCSKNFVIANKLFFQLTNLGYHVWFDNESLCGGNYDKGIGEAINKSKAFIALLSPEIADDLAKGYKDSYYVKEWKIAAQLGTEHIIPLAVNGYNLRSDYHHAFEEAISLVEDDGSGNNNGKISGFDLTKSGDFAKLKEKINGLLTI